MRTGSGTTQAPRSATTIRDAVADPYGPRTPYRRGALWPARVDLQLDHGLDEDDVEEWYRSASVLHSNGDAFDVAVRHGRIVGVRGRPGDHANRGRLGPTDLYGWRATQHRDRLTLPLVRGRDGRLEPTTWDAAMERPVRRIRDALRRPGGARRIAFYSSGQLFLEEYWALATVARGGIGTPHLDGNTRLCTATAAASLKESFGSDGQPGCYDDIDHCDTLALWGHDVAVSQTVLWARMLDRLQGPDRPALLVMDPRRTAPAREADVHLRPRPGTNLPVLLAILHEVIRQGWWDRAYVARHATGLEELVRAVAPWSPAVAQEHSGVPVRDLRAAAELLGGATALLSTVLQGVYQSHQATATACQVNNLHLLRGQLGRPGSGVLQMNGQPTAQNARECGADGDLPGFRNFANPDHVRELAAIWNVDPDRIPHDAPPTDASHIFELARAGELDVLWISGTNPAVSMPDLAQVRDALLDPRVLVVVQDGYPTETTELADVVLPAAIWGEKTGAFTNAERTLHLSEQAVAPPGEARSDLEIFCDLARRLDLRDRDGRPMADWTGPADAFVDWARASRGRPCDISGLSHTKLRRLGDGIRWPVTRTTPLGTTRLYGRGGFPTDPDACETYGHDLVSGEPYSRERFVAETVRGKARLRAASVVPCSEPPDPDHPFVLTTGRTLTQFHTRTKTGRVAELDEAAPGGWCEIAAQDAAALGVGAGAPVRVSTRRGAIVLPARIADIVPGVVFLPFHYGGEQAANELTLAAVDPVSKQPQFKNAACRVEAV